MKSEAAASAAPVNRYMSEISRNTDVVIIGGGASGLAAAIELGMKAPELSVLVIEKMPEPARKIKATGSGRCNISNVQAEGFSRIMEFFREIGLVTRVYDNGLVYPYSESASDVAELLAERAVSLGISFACGEEAVSVRKDGCGTGRFVTESAMKDRSGEHHILTSSDFVILATGGKAGPSYGTTGDGYRIAKELGHSIVTPVPALTGIECAEWDEDSVPCAAGLGGTRSQGVVSLYRDGAKRFGKETKVFEEAGEIQFTRYGLSGICVFNMTRCMRYDKSEGEGPEDFLVRADLFPDGDVREFIRDRQEGRFADMYAGDLLCTVLKQTLAEYIMVRASTAAGLHGAELAEKPLYALTDRETEIIASHVHALSFRPTRIRGWKDAQVSMGGVSLDETDEETSESKLEAGLYITGELADRDFMCGGFNLSNAWLTGLAAADDIAGIR